MSIFRNIGQWVGRQLWLCTRVKAVSTGGSVYMRPNGRPVAIDPAAVSESPSKPAFVARPEGAPVYYGFEIALDVTVDGFTLGKITDFEAEPCDSGDAFVIAPDGSRAGLVWEVSGESYFDELLPIEHDRWGVWAVGFEYPMTSRENARSNLAAALPRLREKWELWKQQFRS
jgi:hypothetical protein